ncbi:MAG: tetrahydromethanopterin S-methyltransferase subunit H, partial [Promethearchaeota archaeon]
MFDFNTKQKTYKVGEYSIGGDPRKAPTAAIGSIFYLGQKNIFRDESKGKIDKEYAEKIIKKQEELASKTGLVPGLEVILSYKDSIKPILDFV